jgi:hypothetical protein
VKEDMPPVQMSSLSRVASGKGAGCECTVPGYARYVCMVTGDIPVSALCQAPCIRLPQH